MANNKGVIPVLTFWQKIKEVVTKPHEFFDAIQQEVEIKDVIIYYFLVQLLVLPFGIGASLIIGVTETITLSILIYLASVAMGAVLFFIVILIYNLIVSWLGGKQGYTRTAQAFVYGSTPGMLLSWLPIANIIASIYSIYVTIVGLIKLQQMERNKAILAYFIPVIVIFVLVLLFLLIVSLVK